MAVAFSLAGVGQAFSFPEDQETFDKQNKLEHQIWETCSKRGPKCVAACKTVPKDPIDYKLGMFCADRIRVAEAAGLKGDKACSKTQCVIRLKEYAENRYRGAGLNFVCKIGSGQMDCILTDKKKRKTSFWEGGTANTMNYEKGPWKNATFASFDGGYILKFLKSQSGQ